MHNIGNLTLIRHNQELGQKPFKEKKNTYRNLAGLQIAKTKIIDQDHWNKDTIVERCTWMADYIAREVLPIPDEMRRANNYAQREGHALSFIDLQLVGEDIHFHKDPTIVARVVSDKEVEFEGKRWHLSPLTKMLQERRGEANSSGAYQGAQYWDYDGIRLADII